jgi:hypothetical protein
MYKADLSYRVMQRYLAEIVGAQLIAFKDEKQNYSLTSKGREFLEPMRNTPKPPNASRKDLTNLRQRRRSLRNFPDEQMTVDDP